MPPSKINPNSFIGIFLSVLGGIHLSLLMLILRIPIGMAIMDTLVTYLSLAILVSLSKVIAHRLLPKYSQIFVLIMQSLILSVVWAVSFHWMVDYYFYKQEHYIVFWNNTIFIRAIIAWILLCNFSLVHFLASNQVRAMEEKEQTLYHEQLRREAELFKLQQQINPHFLFNTLNSINALVGISTDRARLMIQQLSQYFRNTLKKDVQHITLAEEIDDIRLYFEIEKVRFGHRLDLQEDVDIHTLSRQIPPLIIQPLMENAIKYGLYGTLGKIVISFKVTHEDEHRLIGTPHLLITIENPFDTGANAVKGTGFGITSIKRRLFLIYGRDDLLRCHTESIITDQIPDSTMKKFVARLIIPILQ